MEQMPEKNPAEEISEAAYQKALQEEVRITLEKKAGSAVFHRKIEASSAAAALNGIACLIREYAALVDLAPVKVLAVLATVMTVPTIRERMAEEKREEP